VRQALPASLPRIDHHHEIVTHPSLDRHLPECGTSSAASD
jgi:hypothetical protein